ncbi:hypothetical protein HHK36_015138 [Tetracentron sinense]|uniref:Uncharacterized protein n=1 Tax=Tetracentron sinense TaxID=13715 RepID=A0A835DCH6_TETSI|nr:hypothetical protein HHK36_015138 [Tetracentron sinense]
MSNYASTLTQVMARNRPHVDLDSDDEPFNVPSFEWIKLTRNDIESPFNDLEPKEYWTCEFELKAWCVGSLCMVEPPGAQPLMKPIWVQWLDTKLIEEGTVIFVDFGAQAEISDGQLQEIAIGLEKPEINFLWVVRSKGLEILEGFEERVKGRGVVSICASVPILAWPMMARTGKEVKEIGEEARRAMEEGGSSWCTLDQLIHETFKK